MAGENSTTEPPVLVRKRDDEVLDWFELMNALRELLIRCTLTIDQNVIKYLVSEIYNVQKCLLLTIQIITSLFADCCSLSWLFGNIFQLRFSEEVVTSGKLIEKFIL